MQIKSPSPQAPKQQGPIKPNPLLRTKIFPKHPAKLVLILLMAFVVSIYIWATNAKVEQSARAMGQIIAVSRTQLVQAANEGVIKKILVKEGDKVTKGQLLVQLEDVQTLAAVNDSQAKVAALKAAVARLQAEVFSRPLVFPDDLTSHPVFVKNQTELYKRRQTALKDEIHSLNVMLEAVKKELNMSMPLLKTGDIGETEVLRLERSVAELKGNMVNKQNKFFQDSQAEMTKAEEDLSTQQQILSERLVNLEHTKLTAPADGLVRSIRLTTLGGKIRAGDVIMEIFPTGSRLIVEVKLKPADLAFVKVGQDANVKLDAYDYTIYGVMRGKVIYVSPDALTEETRQGESIYYRVHLGMNKQQSIKTRGGKKIEFLPGMTVQAEIRTGSMSIMQYLMKPIAKTLSSAFSQR